MSACPAGHFFCNGCWAGHIEAQVGGGATAIRCMAPGCAAALAADDVEALAAPAVLARLARFDVSKFAAGCAALPATASRNRL